MNEPFDVLLREPGPEQLLAALEQARVAAGLGAGIPGTRVWLIEEMSGAHEGLAKEEDGGHDRRGRARYVRVAWWRDHRGGRLVRVVGGDTGDRGFHPHFSFLDEDQRPPVWHVCPDRVYRVKRGEAAPVWLASCVCATTGRPEQLAWMGRSCGPCHDRREEGDPLTPPDRSGLLLQGADVLDLAFAPDGGRLAVSVKGCTLRLLDLDGPREDLVAPDPTARTGPDEQIRPLAFSPDGRWLGAASPRLGGLRVWEYPQRERADQLRVPSPLPLRQLAFSPDGQRLAACGQDGQLFRWSHDGRAWHPILPQLAGATAISFAPDGKRLAVGGGAGQVQLVDTRDFTPQQQISTGAGHDEEVFFLEFLPDGNRLVFLIGSTHPGRFREMHQLRLWDLKRTCEVRSELLGPCSLIALSSDGRTLAWTSPDDRHSWAAVHFWDVEAWREAGWLEWDPEKEVRALAFSPDGQALALGVGGAVKLCPWRLLLEG